MIFYLQSIEDFGIYFHLNLLQVDLSIQHFLRPSTEFAFTAEKPEIRHKICLVTISYRCIVRADRRNYCAERLFCFHGKYFHNFVVSLHELLHLSFVYVYIQVKRWRLCLCAVFFYQNNRFTFTSPKSFTELKLVLHLLNMFSLWTNVKAESCWTCGTQFY